MDYIPKFETRGDQRKKKQKFKSYKYRGGGTTGNTRSQGESKSAKSNTTNSTQLQQPPLKQKENNIPPDYNDGQLLQEMQNDNKLDEGATQINQNQVDKNTQHYHDIKLKPQEHIYETANLNKKKTHSIRPIIG